MPAHKWYNPLPLEGRVLLTRLGAAGLFTSPPQTALWSLCSHFSTSHPYTLWYLNRGCKFCAFADGCPAQLCMSSHFVFQSFDLSGYFLPLSTLAEHMFIHYWICRVSSKRILYSIFAKPISTFQPTDPWLFYIENIFEQTTSAKYWAWFFNLFSKSNKEPPPLLPRILVSIAFLLFLLSIQELSLELSRVLTLHCNPAIYGKCSSQPAVVNSAIK